MYKTETATEEELRDWNNTISKCNYSEALHTLEWQNALTSSFKQLKPLYFAIKNSDDKIVGAMPCFAFSPFPYVTTLLSMPWSLPGGPLILSGENSTGATLSVCNKLDEISRRKSYYETAITLPADYNEEIANGLLSAGYSGQTDHFTHILDIKKGYDYVWKSYNKRVRGAIRKADKTGVVVTESESESDMMGFYKMYLSMMQNFGSTPKPFSLLRQLQKSSIARLVVAWLDQKMIAGLLFIHFNRNVRLWCEASEPEFLSYRPNNAIIDYIIQWASNRGYSFIDFGASPPENEGLVAFKEEWGARKASFSIFTRLYSPRRKKLWLISEPSIRRIYAAVQGFRI